MKCKTCKKELHEPEHPVIFGIKQVSQCINEKCPESVAWRLSQTNDGYPVDDMKDRIDEARKTWRKQNGT